MVETFHYKTSHFGHTDEKGNWIDAEIDVPTICFSCFHFEGGEYGDFGEMLNLPSCGRYLFFPTKKGTCKKYIEKRKPRIF